VILPTPKRTPRGLLDSRQPSSTEAPMPLIGLAVVLAVGLARSERTLKARKLTVGAGARPDD